MELRQYASILWRWLWLIVLGTVLAAASSYYVSKTIPKVYGASTTLLVNQAQTPGTVSYNDVLTNMQLAKTYTEMILKRPVLQNALARLHMTTDPLEFQRALSVQAVRDTMLLQLKAESTDPQFAADMANAVAQAFIEENRRAQMGQAAQSRDALEGQIQSLEKNISSTTDQLNRLRTSPGALSPEAVQAEMSRLQTALSQYQVTYSDLLKSDQEMRLAEAKVYSSVAVVEPATANPIPVRPKTAQNVALAGIVGLLLAAGVALLIEYLDDSVKTADDVARVLGVPVLGYVTRLKGGKKVQFAPLVARDPRSPVSEAFRTLRTNLQFSLVGRPGRVILVTSSSPEEGKTTTVVNLAMVMAQAGQRVIVVDTDLRRPTLHRHFGLKNDSGVTTALLELDFSGALSSSATGVENLTVVTSGPLPPNPSELLGSARMASFIEWLKGSTDVVLFDSPPALAVTDPSVLARLADGVVVVVDSRSTRAGALARTRETLERAAGPGKLLGVVLNKLAAKSGGSYYYYHYYQSSDGQGNNGKNGHQKVAESLSEGQGADRLPG